MYALARSARRCQRTAGWAEERGRTSVCVGAGGLQRDGLFPGGDGLIVLLLTGQHLRRRWGREGAH